MSASVPIMGQKLSIRTEPRQGYLEDLDWDESLTVSERRERGPFQSAFAVGRSDAAAEAVKRAQRDVDAAGHAFDQVMEQAVYALMREGVGLREIADRLRTSKSTIGRISASFEREDGVPVSYATPAPVGADADDIRGRIRSAWGHC